MVADKIIKWLRENKIILLIVALTLFLRLFRISSYMTFLGDEGRDALVWLRMVREGKFVLAGPPTSIGYMYLGPLFYYLMLPFYAILGTSGPAIGTALFGGGTAFLLWLSGREWFSEKVGLLAAFLYAISPVAIELSRSAWNPNIMPFFALLFIYGVWQFWGKGNFIWLAITGFSLSVILQSHYLGLLLIPVAGLFWLLKLRKLLKQKGRKLTKTFFLHSFLGLAIFIILTILPLAWFDLRHNFLNAKAFYIFFTFRQTTVNLKVYKAIPNLWPLWQMTITRLVAGKNVLAGFWSAIAIAILLLGSAKKKAYFLVLAWVFAGLVGLGLYKQHIYDHYFGFLFPAIFLLTALALERLWSLTKGGKILFLGALTIFVYFAFQACPLRGSPQFQMQHTWQISQKIIEEAGNQPFNIGLIAKQNYDAGYRYFLEKSGHKPVLIDAQRSNETITNQLFVVCEESVCEPTTHPQAEIASFGWSKIEEEWTFPWGVKLFKLIHAK